MQLPGFAIVIHAIPIVNAIRGVAVLLDLDQHVAAADRVKSAGWQKNGVTGLDCNRVHKVCRRPSAHGFLELSPGDRTAKCDMKSGARNRRNDIPKLRFWFATELGRDFFRGMNLQRKLLVSVKQFDK